MDHCSRVGAKEVQLPPFSPSRSSGTRRNKARRSGWSGLATLSSYSFGVSSISFSTSLIDFALTYYRLQQCPLSASSGHPRFPRRSYRWRSSRRYAKDLVEITAAKKTQCMKAFGNMQFCECIAERERSPVGVESLQEQCELSDNLWRACGMKNARMLGGS